VGVLVAAGIGLAIAILSPQPRAFLWSSTACFVLVPLVVLVNGLPPPFFVSPTFVGGDLLAHYLAGAGLTLLVVGIVRDRRSAEAAVPVMAPPPPEEAALIGGPAPALRRRPLLRRPSFGVWLATISVAGFVLRLAVSSGAIPDVLSSQIAAHLLAGAGYSLPGPFGALAPTALRAPVTPALLTVAQTSASPEFAARVIWAVAGAGTVAAVGVVGRRLFAAGPGLLAAALVALLPAFFLDNVRMTSGTVAALIVTLLLLAITNSTGIAYSTARAGLAGILVGILALARPEGLLIGAVIVVPWLTARSAAVLPAARRATFAVAAAIGLAMVLGPWVARNHGELGTYLPTTESGTITAGANAASTYGDGLIGSFDPAAARTTAADVSTKPLGEGALDRRLLSEAGTYATSHIGGLLEALPVRVARAFELWSPANERDAHAARGLSVKGWILQWTTFLPLLALSLWGYWRLRARALGDLMPLYLPPLAVSVVALVSYGEPLARRSIDPLLALVAAAGVWAFGRPQSFTLPWRWPRWGRPGRRSRRRGRHHGTRRWRLWRRRRSAV